MLLQQRAATDEMKRLPLIHQMSCLGVVYGRILPNCYNESMTQSHTYLVTGQSCLCTKKANTNVQRLENTKNMINPLEQKIVHGAIICWIHRKTERVLLRFMMSHTIQASISQHHTKRQTLGSNRKRHSKILMLHRKKHQRMKVHPTQLSTTGLPMNRHLPTCWCTYHLTHRHSLSVSCMIPLHV